jgi:hypothetical protein
MENGVLETAGFEGESVCFRLFLQFSLSVSFARPLY